MLFRIKPIHNVLIRKNISHLITDYFCTTNLCVYIGM